VLSFVSYRDPNLLKTLEVFDESARFLRDMKLHKDELRKSIIGTIGDLDQYRLPDAKGYTSMVRQLSGETDEERQQLREEVLGTSATHFTAFAEALDTVKEEGLVKVLGSGSAIQGAQTDRPGWLEVLKVL
jgi:Zn-dependent M16 (insulinase) family peptidase